MISISLEFYYFVTRRKYYWLIFYVLIEKETCARAEKPDPCAGRVCPPFSLPPSRQLLFLLPPPPFLHSLLQTFLLMFHLLNQIP